MHSISKIARQGAHLAFAFFGTLVVTGGAYGAYSSFVSGDYALPRSWGSANLTSASWNKLLDNVEDLQSRVGAGGSPGQQVGFAYANNVTNSNVTATIPWDDTVPQNTEGTEVMSVTITPKSATNLLEVEAVVHYSEDANSSDYFVLSGFKDSATSAFASAASNTAWAYCSPASGYTYVCQAKFHAVIPAGTTSATAIRLRAGANAAGNVQINGSSGRKLWGTMNSFLSVREIAQ